MKHYTKPETTVVEIQHSCCLLQAVSSVQSGDIFDPEITGGSVNARSREEIFFSEEEW